MSKNKEQKIKAAKKEVKTIDLILTGIFIFLIAFVITMIVVAYTLSYEPSTLIASVFAFCGLECGLLASITKRKTALKKEVEQLSNGEETASLVFDEIDNMNNGFIDDSIYDKYNSYNTDNSVYNEYDAYNTTAQDRQSYIHMAFNDSGVDNNLYHYDDSVEDETYGEIDLMPIYFDSNI